MRIALVIEYARPMPWTAAGPWAEVIGSALVRAGHEVTLFADGVSSVEPFATAGMGLRVHRPERRSIEVSSPRFRRWVGGAVSGDAFDGVVSLARTWCGACPEDARDELPVVWIPMGRSARVELSQLARRRNPATLVMQGSHRLWIWGMWRAEAAARRDASAAGLEPARIGRGLPIVGRFDRLDDAAWAERRAFARGLLRLTDEPRPVLAASAAHFGTPGWRDMMSGLAEVPPPARPVIVMSGGGAHAVTTWFGRAGLGESLMAMGPTNRMDLLLAAADAALVAGGDPDGDPHQDGAVGGRGGTGRLIGDALRLGVPVIAGAGAVGADRVGRAGMVVPKGGWKDALIAAREPGWREGASAAARNRREEFDPAVLAGAIGRLLAK